ncbi:MAG TPA: YceI family protein [Steroidobacteraceae bacterium]|nr:YceI family protein [Steroidobacteraceae bacterium]
MARAVIAGLAALVVALPGAGVAWAGGWQGDGKAGMLEFTATQAGARFTGRFTDFRVEFDFDPASPATGRLHVTISTASTDTQDDDRDGILRSEDFFWSGRHPQAVYHAERFERDGPGWRAQGMLTLRGVTKEVPVHFELAPGKERLGMTGGTRLRRLAFGVGQGDWSSTEWIGDEVGIAFELSLSPAAPATSP